jgi:uncharacterized membrane protein
MATVTRKQQAGGPGQTARASAKKAAKPAKKATKPAAQKTKAAAKRVADTAKPDAGIPGPGKLARFAAGKVMKATAKGALRSGAKALRTMAEQAAVAGKDVYERAASNRLPVQVSVDVAVPLQVAWEEWMSSSTFTEGVHRIEEVERDGDVLIGKIAGPRGGDWEAEIVDERAQESFAWRSVQGTDCAGLATFHRLSDRLTRIELDLDILPTNPAQAAVLSLHLAHRRAEAQLRRFKAHVEFINPDVYEPELSQNGGDPASASDEEE